MGLFKGLITRFSFIIINRHKTTQKIKKSNSPKGLYKYLIRQCEKLPPGPRQHYRLMVKESFVQHLNETDPDRIKQIVQRSYEDADWILNKYLGKDKGGQ